MLFDYLDEGKRQRCEKETFKRVHLELKTNTDKIYAPDYRNSTFQELFKYQSRFIRAERKPVIGT